MEDTRINTFLTPLVVRMLTACVTGFIIKLILATATQPAIATLVSIGVGIGTYLTSGQRYTVTDKALKIRITLRTFTYPFENGVFRVERVTGIKSFLSCFRANGYILHITLPGKKEQRVAPVLAESDANAMLELLRERADLLEP